MQSSLLRAKFHRPMPPTVAIPRARLLQRWQEGVCGKVTLVSAAAGSGKTTILSAWLDQLVSRPPSAAAPDMIKVSWLTPDKMDDQLPRFLRYLVTASEEHFPHSCIAVTVLLQENPNPASDVVADLLTNSLDPQH